MMKYMNVKYGLTVSIAVCCLLPATGIAASSEAAAIKLGGLNLVPSLGLAYKHDDNIFAQETRTKSSNITLISPALLLQARSGTKSFELGYQLEKGIYHSSRADDYIDHLLAMAIEADLTRRLDTSLHVAYNKKHDPRGSTFTGTAGVPAANPDKYHETTVGAAVGYGLGARIDLSADYANKRYDNNRFRTIARDLNTTGGTAAFSFPVMKKTRAVVEARYKKFDYQLLTATTNLDSNEQRYYAGLDWEATAKTSGSLRLGYLKKHFDAAALANRSKTSGFSWELGMTWMPQTYSTVDLSTQSTIDETDGTGTHIESTGGHMTWNHQWNDKLSHTVNVSYTKKDYIGQVVATPRKDKLTTAGVSVNYQVQRWLKLGVSYDYTKNSSNTVNASYSKNVVTVSFVGTL